MYMQCGKIVLFLLMPTLLEELGLTTSVASCLYCLTNHTVIKYTTNTVAYDKS